MKKFVLLFFLQLALPFVMAAQSSEGNVIHKDLDGDGIKDRVWLDAEEAQIHYLVSGSRSKASTTIALGEFSPQSSLSEAKNGFILSNPAMRSGETYQFRYEPKVRRFRLIGIRNYNFGNAANEGSGHESINLLTGEYSACWNFFDHENETLRGFPEFRTRIKVPVVYLDHFEAIGDLNAWSQTEKLWERHKKNAFQKNLFTAPHAFE